LTKEMTEMDVAEKEAQKEYEQFIADSADKRANDSKYSDQREPYGPARIDKSDSLLVTSDKNIAWAAVEER